MKTPRPALLAALAGLACATACSSSSAPLVSGPPTGQSERPVRSPCDGGKILLLDELKLSCNEGFPPSPESADLRYWNGEQPCRRTTVMADGTEGETRTYDYSKPYEFHGATYDASGNIASFDLAEFFPGNMTMEKIIYEYDADHRLKSAHIDPPLNGAEHDYTMHYEGGRRSSDEGGNGSWYYVYDGDGRIIAEGLQVNGQPPVRYDESLLTADAMGKLPNAPVLTESEAAALAASTAHAAYFYNGEGRLKTVGIARAPGLQYSKYEYNYEGGRLTSVKTIAEDNIEQPSQTWTYHYDDCGM